MGKLKLLDSLLQETNMPMPCIFQLGSNFDGVPGSIQFFKEVEKRISETDVMLKNFQEVEERNWTEEMEAEEEPFNGIFPKFRVALKAYVGRIRYVIDKMTNPSKLLELAALAVSSYDLPINEIPVELEILLHEGSTQTQANKLKEEIEILKRDVPMVLKNLSWILNERIRHASYSWILNERIRHAS